MSKNSEKAIVKAALQRHRWLNSYGSNSLAKDFLKSEKLSNALDKACASHLKKGRK